MLKRHQERTGGSPAQRRWLVPTRWLVTAGASAALFGCPNEELAPLEPCTVSGVSNEIAVNGVDKVDVLFMVDNSASMAANQSKLAQRLPDLVKSLTTGYLNPADMGTGKAPDFSPVRDLHLGVITCNLGAGGVAGVPSCSGPGTGLLSAQNLGDDGLLITTAMNSPTLPNINPPQPNPSYDPNCANFTLRGAGYTTNYLGYIPGTTMETTDKLAQDFKCVALTGVNGCGFEQQLEAPLKALSPSSNCTFNGPTGPTCGHGDRENAGFMRPDAVLAIILATDEDDCSTTAAGRGLYQQDTRDPQYLIPPGQTGSPNPVSLNLRCAWLEGKYVTSAQDAPSMQPLQRYIDGYKKLKPDNPDRVIFAAITGIPDGTEGQTPDQILANPKMQFTAIDRTTGQPTADFSLGNAAPTPACSYVSGNFPGSAGPGVRYVKVVKGFGANGGVYSICAPDFSPALTNIVKKISQQLKGACLPHALNPDKQGIVECDIVEILPVGTPKEACQAQNGRVFLEYRNIKNEQGVMEQRTVCQINQVAVSGDPNNPFKPSPKALPNVPPLVGWFYDDFTDDMKKSCPTDQQQRLSFNPESAKPQNATVKFECFQPVSSSDPNAKGKDAVGTTCKDDPNLCTTRSSPQTDVQNGLGYLLTCDGNTKTCQIPCKVDSECPAGWVCDLEGQPTGLCVLPTCPPSNIGGGG